MLLTATVLESGLHFPADLDAGVRADVAIAQVSHLFGVSSHFSGINGLLWFFIR